MKSSIIPADITSSEDKIAWNLSITQVILLIVPVFLTGILFIILPPFTKFEVYKLVIAFPFILIFSILSIRIKDRIVLDIVITRFRYYFRPRLYIYNSYTYVDSIPNAKKQKISPGGASSYRHKPNYLNKFRLADLEMTDNRLRVSLNISKKGALYAQYVQNK